MGSVAARELPVTAIVGDGGGRGILWGGKLCGGGEGGAVAYPSWVRSGSPATMVSAAVEEAALATYNSFAEAVGERRMGAVTMQQVKLLLKQVELFS